VDDAQFAMSRDVVKELSPQVKLSFTPGALYAGRGMEALKPFLVRTDILFINRDEIENLTGLEFRKAAVSCIKAGCKAVAVTLGKGIRHEDRNIAAYVYDGRNEWFIEPGNPERLKIIDTTGAGDAFAAGFLFGLLEIRKLETCGKLGNCLARLSLKSSGAREGLPTRRRLEQYFTRLYAESL
jgi:ribokinase